MGHSPSIRLVLASRSPQRSAILARLGIPYRVVVSAYDEQLTEHDPHASAEANARGKALDVLEHCSPAADELVLGVDTLVLVGGRILGKAASAAAAAESLRLLSGRTHEVVSGLYLGDRRRQFCGHALTSVTFAPLSAEAVATYVATGEWQQRAGAYAIQGFGSALVEGVDGDYQNVVGLPVALLVTALASLGVPPLSWCGGDGSD